MSEAPPIIQYEDFSLLPIDAETWIHNCLYITCMMMYMCMSAYNGIQNQRSRHEKRRFWPQH